MAIFVQAPGEQRGCGQFLIYFAFFTVRNQTEFRFLVHDPIRAYHEILIYTPFKEGNRGKRGKLKRTVWHFLW